MPVSERRHVTQFLDPESKRSLSEASHGLHKESLTDADLRCLRATNSFVACSGAFVSMRVGPECLNFCDAHVNESMSAIINIMASGRLFTYRESEEIALPANVNVSVERATEFETTILLQFPTQTAQQNIGDWAIGQLDFRSTEWGSIIFTPGIPVHNLYYKDEDSRLWQLHYDTDSNSLTITNPHFVMPQEIEQEQEEEDFEPEELGRPLVLNGNPSHCQPIACSNVLRDYVLDANCLRSCQDNISQTVFDILNLFADNYVFVKDERDRTYKLHTFDVMVIGENLDTSLHLIKNGEHKHAGQRAITTFDFTRSDWTVLSIVFEKSHLHSQNHATLMWVQTDENQIFIKGFRESDTTISVRIANPLNLDMETPD